MIPGSDCYSSAATNILALVSGQTHCFLGLGTYTSKWNRLVKGYVQLDLILSNSFSAGFFCFFDITSLVFMYFFYFLADVLGLSCVFSVWFLESAISLWSPGSFE